jgi:hypothetical protein
MEKNEEGIEVEKKARRTWEGTKHQTVTGRSERTKEKYRKREKLRKF